MIGQAWAVKRRLCRPVPLPPRSAFAGFRFPPEVIVVAVRWYLRYGMSYRDVEELLAERGVEVDHDIRATQRTQQKQGAAFGHAKVGGYRVLLRGLNPLVATISTP
jgi:hypothetical protein